MRKIKKGDNVVVITGRDKGKRGTVPRVVDAEHVVVAGINLVKKHQRPNPMKGEQGGIVDKDMPIHISNVAICNPATRKADRVGISMLEDGRKVRFFKSNGELIGADGTERRRHGPPARKSTSKEVVPALIEAVRLQVRRWKCRASPKIIAQHGRGRGGRRQEDHGQRRRRPARRSPGQKPVVTKAKKAIAGFKIREGYPIGCMVTLRRERMYEFLDRLVTIALPRVRDFRGISGRAFDGRGNFNMGVKEQIIFPEIEYDKIDALRGMNIRITTTAKTDDEAKALLAAFRFPFKN